MIDKELDQLLRVIHEELERYLYPMCNKCRTKRTDRYCRCDESRNMKSREKGR